MSDKAIKLAREYCAKDPSWGFLKIRGDREGIMFTGPDEPREGTFIPFAFLGYNPAVGFFDTRLMPQEKSV